MPKLLTIEKLQTGARHFVVLDFGQSVRLTDIFIPTCLDLSSLVIDIWVDGEEKDLSRITVSTDIGSKPLLLTDLLPPLTCRYLKVNIVFLPTENLCRPITFYKFFFPRKIFWSGNGPLA